ncbi:MAG TPA: DUF4235 domain-containing protein [Ornithinimicrobium sp.]|uniref:DUF4235 domain-containing protein n=1 Tax=Ornithinimicrobium sp. TaxID=1977084 RepID=UPI002B47279F|nr:DUF4235 domain-containing protein [Ornithinimicrobium sp.]HKJ10845.1 DUF4235 domain-containing protein [Ornithinimicrobium sp.]
MGDAVWKVMALGSAIGASMVARNLTEATWKFIRGDEPPKNPEDPDTAWLEAVGFALLSGAIVGLSRMVANREAAAVYKKSTGHLPKPMQS